MGERARCSRAGCRSYATGRPAMRVWAPGTKVATMDKVKEPATVQVGLVLCGKHLSSFGIADIDTARIDAEVFVSRGLVPPDWSTAEPVIFDLDGGPHPDYMEVGGDDA